MPLAIAITGHCCPGHSRTITFAGHHTKTITIAGHRFSCHRVQLPSPGTAAADTRGRVKTIQWTKSPRDRSVWGWGKVGHCDATDWFDAASFHRTISIWKREHICQVEELRKPAGDF